MIRGQLKRNENPVAEGGTVRSHDCDSHVDRAAQDGDPFKVRHVTLAMNEYRRAGSRAAPQVFRVRAPPVDPVKTIGVSSLLLMAAFLVAAISNAGMELVLQMAPVALVVMVVVVIGAALWTGSVEIDEASVTVVRGRKRESFALCDIAGARTRTNPRNTLDFYAVVLELVSGRTVELIVPGPTFGNTKGPAVRLCQAVQWALDGTSRAPAPEDKK